MWQYDISIVIPVYNSEKYIGECIKSICNQNYSKLDKIQVILINDGSKDKSLDVCNKIKQESKDIRVDVLTGENAGVSLTRNKGIKASKGKYIMFLDSDDYISENTIKDLIDFFEKNYEKIDLVTYPMYEYHMKNGKIKPLHRYEVDFEETKVYELKENYQCIQPTMNIVIKNRGNDNPLFDSNVKFNEDTLYNTSILMDKMAIGYVKEAKYIYRIHNNSTTNNRENPLYSFDQYMSVFESLFDKYKDESGKTVKYAQRLFLNVVRYRILKDKLFPYHLKGENWDKAYLRFIKLINRVDNKVIMEYDEMDINHRFYILTLKGQELKEKDVYSDKKIALEDENGNIYYVEDKISIVINRFEIDNNKINILGHLKSPIFRFVNPELLIKYVNDKKDTIVEKVEVSDKTVANRYKTDMECAKFFKYDIQIDLNRTKEFKLCILVNGKERNVNYYFNTWAPFSPAIGIDRIYRGDYRILFKDDSFAIRRPTKKRRIKDEIKSTLKIALINRKAAIYRILARILVRRKKRIWLYIDRNNVFDNAYYQFKHDIKIKDGIKRYYVVDGKKKDYRKNFTIRELKKTIKFRSFRHKILFLNSEKVLTSFSSLSEHSPFNKKNKLYKDILKYQLIYLQHGVLHAFLPRMYSKGTSKIGKFVISSNFEKNNLISNYDYKESDLICTGMPRFDIEKNIKEPENKIVFAPSWRKYLIGETVNRERETNVEQFLKSKYYKETINFLKSEELLKILKDNNIVLDFKLHPIFEVYKDCFDTVKNENIIVSIGNTDLSKYKAFITDFSSFQFDYVRLQRPIIYFMPDMEEFKAGLHSYRELDLKYENAFGKLCLTGKELDDELIKIIKNDFKAEQIYKERMEKFFFSEKDNRQNLYKTLIKGEN